MKRCRIRDLRLIDPCSLLVLMQNKRYLKKIKVSSSKTTIKGLNSKQGLTLATTIL